LLEDPQELHPVLQERDPDFMRRFFPVAAWISDNYYRAEVEGVEHLSDRASLLVSTHNGGMATPDIYCLAVAFMRRFGLEAPLYSLAHKMAFLIPGFSTFTRKSGAVMATPENAKIILDADFPILLCPGGDVDSLKPFSRRHKITFNNRMGFIRTAIRHQVPIVPVVSVGAHEVIFVLNDGRGLARLIRFDKIFRIKTIPMSFSFPWGFTLGALGSIPLPSKIKIRVLPPMEFNEPASAAEDPVVLQRCYKYVCGAMQQALDEMAAQRRWPVIG